MITSRTNRILKEPVTDMDIEVTDHGLNYQDDVEIV
jgi:hypothetical protein